MPDVHDPATRSRNMAAIRGRDTKPELLIRSGLHRQGYRFRVNRKDLTGKPDIVLSRFHAVIFVHGCFWHGHDCHLFRLPGTRTEFWAAKIGANQERDKVVGSALLSEGWRIATVWECALKGKSRIELKELLTRLTSWLRGDELLLEIRCQDVKSMRASSMHPPEATEPDPSGR
ncbi:very short patch repair endonuclease [Croceicoccus marinus]|uniref:DNA mismatch endonuclease Vsr n=1 Tax=Croceicoccus marinus TaxID=450378 RepID=A0A7G6VU02_9SPHN|nr:DNA mismatch endonuclease Vsr [Croceicoccus marinus]QNE05217.1 DNA mismatch endonuclease Vsr [Croceicoccus marinus]